MEEQATVTVSDVRCAPDGHTVYFVTLVAHGSTELDDGTPKEVCRWFRYSAISRFHRQLLSLLQSHEAQAQLPSLPKGKVTGHSGSDLAEQRRLACEKFLQAAAKIPAVMKSSVWWDFFREEDTSPLSSRKRALSLTISAGSDEFHPTLVSPMEPVSFAKVAGSRDSSGSLNSLPEVPVIEENDVLCSLTPTHLERSHNEGLHETSSSELIPVAAPSDSIEQLSPRSLSPIEGPSSVWFNRAPSPAPEECVDTLSGSPHFSFSAELEEDLADASQATLANLSLIDEEEPLSFSLAPGEESGELSDESTGEEEVSAVDGGLDCLVPRTAYDRQDSMQQRNFTDLSDSVSSSASDRPTKLEFCEAEVVEKRSLAHNGSANTNNDVGNGSEVDYIVTASRMISRAVNAEGKSQYMEAYDLYIGGVGVLLSGVQTDRNAYRRDAVRHKTAQYLQRAEVLQRTHSSDECSNHLHEEVGQLPYRPTSDLQGKQSTAARVLSALESPPASLSYLTNIHQHSTSLDFIERPVHVGPRLLDYRVLRPVGKCMLVENKYTGDVYLIKSLAKCQSTAGNSSTKRSRCLMKFLCPYMVKPIGHFETAGTIFLLLEYVQRGCLWDQLARFRTHASSESPSEASHSDGLPEKQVRRWCAQLVVALSHLHFSDFIWKDLRPRNLLLSEEGMVLLTYSGDWEHVDRPLSSWAIKHLFVAPELSARLTTPSPAADWWSLGVIAYELLTGSSFLSCHPGGMTTYTSPVLPSSLSEASKSLLRGLLQVNPQKRLGVGPSGVDEIKGHPFFAKIRGWHT